MVGKSHHSNIPVKKGEVNRRCFNRGKLKSLWNSLLGQSNELEHGIIKANKTTPSPDTKRHSSKPRRLIYKISHGFIYFGNA